MKKDPDQNSTDSAEIEALITRLERGQLHEVARLLRLLLRLITLLQQKNASLARLKRLLFGPRSDTRREANSSSAPGAEGESDSASSTLTENSSPFAAFGGCFRSLHGGRGAFVSLLYDAFVVERLFYMACGPRTYG